MTTYISRKRTKLNRNFGKCAIPGCKYRKVVDGSCIDGKSIHYNGVNATELAAIGAWCPEHNKHLNWTQLSGRYVPDRECNGVCMGAIGPSCDCSCGGENHGRNHI